MVFHSEKDKAGVSKLMMFKRLIRKFSRTAAIGLAATILMLWDSAPASANCAAFPKIPLWKTLSHDSTRQLVDRKYDGDWKAYIETLERYEGKLRRISARGAAADVTCKGRKIRLKGAAIPSFLKHVDRRISVTRCLADNRADFDDIANFATAAGCTDGQSVAETRLRPPPRPPVSPPRHPPPRPRGPVPPGA